MRTAAATIVSCAGLAALSGSSVASAVTMGRVCLPEMKRCNYDPRLATGTVAAGGTLGILIPPSTAFIVYAILTEESIGKLLLAGFLPGLLLTVLFVVTITIWTRVQPALGPPGPRATVQIGSLLAQSARIAPSGMTGSPIAGPAARCRGAGRRRSAGFRR